MARKSQAIAILEGKLNLLKAEEAETKQALEAAMAQTKTLEDLLKSLRAALAGGKGGRSRRSSGDKASVPIRQVVVGSINKQAVEAVVAAQQQNNSKETLPA